MAQLHPLVAIRTGNRLPVLLPLLPLPLPLPLPLLLLVLLVLSFLSLGGQICRPLALQLEALQLLDAAREGGRREGRRQLAVGDAAVQGPEEGDLAGGRLVLQMTMG